MKLTSNQIKKALAEKFNAKASDFSVRQDYSSVDITVKTYAIDVEAVQSLVAYDMGKEKIERCEASGEILTGSHYVFVQYRVENDAEIVEAVKAAVTDHFKSDWHSAVDGHSMSHHVKFDQVRGRLDFAIADTAIRMITSGYSHEIEKSVADHFMAVA